MTTIKMAEGLPKMAEGRLKMAEGCQQEKIGMAEVRRLTVMKNLKVFFPDY